MITLDITTNATGRAIHALQAKARGEEDGRAYAQRHDARWFRNIDTAPHAAKIAIEHAERAGYDIRWCGHSPYFAAFLSAAVDESDVRHGKVRT